MSSEAELRLRYQTNRFRETRHQMAFVESDTASVGSPPLPSRDTANLGNSVAEASNSPVTGQDSGDQGPGIYRPASNPGANEEDSGAVNADIEPISVDPVFAETTDRQYENRRALHKLSAADERMGNETGASSSTSEPSSRNVPQTTPSSHGQDEIQVQAVTSDDPDTNLQFSTSHDSVVEPIISSVPVNQNGDDPAVLSEHTGTDNPETRGAEDGIERTISSRNVDCGQLDGVVCSTRRSQHTQRSNSDLEPGRSSTSPQDDNNITPDVVAATGGEISVNEATTPRWQPDAEATYCPICRTQFNFFVRKHHCRKCGRVVCASCSPHRITIPYQFIVQPPASGPAITLPGAPLTRVDTDRLSNFGGMKVRLCNPCVPDPNIMPPRTAADERWRDAPPTYYLSSSRYPHSFGEEDMESLERQSSGTSARSRAASSTSASHHHQLSHSPYPPRSSSQANYSGTSYTGPHHINQGSLSYQRRYPNRNPQGPRHHSHQSLSISSSGSPSNLQPHYRSLLDPSNLQQPQSISSGLDTSRPLPPIPRIREEDECPICHCELPSRTLPNFESLRSDHVNGCIEEQIAFHSGRPRQQSPANIAERHLRTVAATTNSSTSAPLQFHSRSPNSTASSPSQGEISFAQATSLQPPLPSMSSFPNTPEGRTAYREAQHAAVVLGHSRSSSHTPYAQVNSPFSSEPRRTGMFPYKATEKDCVDDAECTICLEEFEVGVQMARLECLCRFHEKCIRSWWEGKPGRCPVHGHDAWGL